MKGVGLGLRLGLLIGVLSLGVLALASLAIAAGASLKDEMRSVVDPASSVLFAVAGEVDPSNGPQATPTPEARWREAALAAGRLRTAAQAMMEPDQIRPGEEWAKDARQLGDLADAANAAALAKDGAKLADAVNALGDNCSACHAKYKSQG